MKTKAPHRPSLLRVIAAVLALSATACGSGVQHSNTHNDEPMIHISEGSVEAAVLAEGLLWLKLNRKGRDQIEDMTSEQLGDKVRIKVLGHEALSLIVAHQIDSGRLVIKNPSAELTDALDEYMIR